MLALYQTAEHGTHWLKQRLDTHAAATRDPRMIVDSTLSHKMSLERGQSMALLATPLQGDLYSFDIGTNRDISEILPTMAHWVTDFVNYDPSHICLIDEQNSSPNDPSWIKDISKNYSDAVMFCEGNIFYRISHTNNDLAYVKGLLNLTYSWYFCCCLVKCNNFVKNCKPYSNLSVEDIQNAITDVKGIAVDAYDLEGLLIWTPTLNKVTPENPFLTTRSVA